MPVTITTDSPPLRVDSDGVIRVGDSRITLDLVIEAYQLGQTPEYFAETHSSVTLAQVHGTIAYYLAHKAELDPYLEAGKRRFEELKEEIESQPGYKEWRDGLRQKLEQRARERGLRP
jgi:uncharacterized protein (DUF433 family)